MGLRGIARPVALEENRSCHYLQPLLGEDRMLSLNCEMPSGHEGNGSWVLISSILVVVGRFWFHGMRFWCGEMN